LKILVDIDGVLCQNGNYTDYALAVPIVENINHINTLYEQGNHIVLYTSRLAKYDRHVTYQWLNAHDVKYNNIMYDKPTADLYIDDKAVNYSDFYTPTGPALGRKKYAICYSAGLDSYVSYHYLVQELGVHPDDIVCIYFDMGHPYAAKERQALQNLGIPYTIVNLDFLRPEFNNMPTIDKFIIPGRNMIFASIAGSIAEHVWIGGLSFEDHYLMFDKNSGFFRKATQCLTHANGELTIVETPYVKMNKTDVIHWALKHDITETMLSNTVSCYHPTLHRCGECDNCFKRYIAMKAAGITEPCTVDPIQSERAKYLIAAYKTALLAKDFSHYSLERITETFDVLGIDYDPA
jgi:7-cyano-7-deazaguanine synthase